MVATRAADAVDVFHRFSRYVRNIPMSAVLDRGGLQQRWVAVNLPCFWMFPDFFFPPPDAKAMGTWEPARYTLQVTL